MSSTAFHFFIWGLQTKIRWSIWHCLKLCGWQRVSGSVCISKTPKLFRAFWRCVCYFSLYCRLPWSPRFTLYSSKVKHTVMVSAGHHYKLTCHYWFCESTNGLETDVTMHSGSRDSPNNFLNNWPARLLLNLITEAVLLTTSSPPNSGMDEKEMSYSFIDQLKTWTSYWYFLKYSLYLFCTMKL